MKNKFRQSILSIAFVFFTGLVLSARGDALDNWTSAQFTTNAYGIRNIAFGNGRYVAVGSEYRSLTPDFGVILTSENGLKWTLRHNGGSSASAFPLRLHRVTYGKGLFVAAGYASSIYTSTNGLDWVLRREGPYGTGIHGITSDGPRFVAVGDGGSVSNIYVSTDGFSWEGRRSVGLTSQIRRINDVAHGTGGYIAVGGSNTYISPDGLTWSQTTIPGVDLNSIVFGNGIFIVPIGVGTNLVSAGIDFLPPFLSWTILKNNSSVQFGKIIYGSGLFVTSGYSSALDADVIFTSTDGTNWVQRNFQYNRPRYLDGLAFGDRRLAAVGTEYGFGFNVTTTTFLSEPFASLTIRNGDQLELAVSGLIGRSYRVEYADTLRSTNWQMLSTFLLTNSPSVLTGMEEANSSQFYRSVLLP